MMKRFLLFFSFLLIFFLDANTQCGTSNYPGNFIVSTNNTYGGIHNVTDTFRVDAGVTLTVPPMPGCGYLEVNAKVIQIFGTIDAIGAGNAGGGGGTPGGCWADNGSTACIGITSCWDKDNCHQLRTDGGAPGTVGAGTGGGAVGVKGNDALGNKQQCNSFDDDSGRIGGAGGGGGGNGGCYAGNGGTSGSGGNGSGSSGCDGNAGCATTGGAGATGGSGSGSICSAYGTSNTYTIEMGSGGGGGGGGGRGRNAATTGGTGGAGGGYVKLVAAGDMIITGAIYADGATGGTGGTGGSAGNSNGSCCSDLSNGCDEDTYTGAGGGGGGGGGGSGGGILLDSQCGSMIVSGTVQANGGTGGTGGSGGSASGQAGTGGSGASGGGGGGGRIKIFSSSCGANNISSTPSVSGGTGANNGTPGTYFAGTNSVTLTAGSISGNQTACSGTSPSPLSNVTPATLGTCTTFNYQWQESSSATGPWTDIPGATSATYNPPALSTTTFFRRIVTAGACSDSTNVVTVTINPSPLVEAGFGLDTICTAGNVLLGGSPTASGGVSPYTYMWTPVAGLNDPTNPNPIATVASTTTYILIVTGSNGCAGTDTITVNYNPLGPVAEAGGGGSNTLCTGGSIILGGNPAASGGSSPYSYSWIPVSGLSNPNISNPVATITANTTYTLSVIDSVGCQAIDSVVVTYNVNGPFADAGFGADSLCTGGSVLIGGNPTATGGVSPYTYSWMPSAGLNDATISNPLATITANSVYYVSVIDAGNCQSADSVTLIYNPSGPFADAGFGADIICSGGTVLLGGAPTGTGGIPPYSYSWIPVTGLDNPLGSNPIATVTSNISYILTLTDSGGCQASDSVMITYNAGGPVADAGGGGSNTLCSGGAIMLGGNPTATSGFPPYIYIWIPSTNLNDSTISNPIATVTGNITYTVSVIDTAGCQSADFVTVTYNPLGPFADAGNGSDSLCSGGAVLLGGFPTANGGIPPYSYSWTPTTGLNNPNDSNPVATISANITYLLIITDSASCQNLDSVFVTYNPSGPSAEAGFGNDTLCTGPGGSTLLGGNPTGTNGIAPYTYQWLQSTGLNNPTSSNPTATITSSTTYMVIVTDAGNCINVDDVTVNPQPIITVNTPLPIPCSGQSTTITASGAVSYIWSPTTGLNPTTGPTVVASPLNTTTYIVSGTDSSSCVGTASVTITVPTVITSIGGSVSTICYKDSNGTATVNSIGGTSPFSYQWDSNAANQTTQTATGLEAGFYSVTVTDANGCTDTISIEVKEPPQMFIKTLVSDLTCSRMNDGWASVDSLAQVNFPVTYLWNDSLQQTASVATNLAAGTYSVTVTDTLGCKDSATVTVVDTIALDAYFTAEPMSGFAPLTVNFTDSSSGNIYVYFWSFGDSLNSTSVVQSPTFTYEQSGEFTVLLVDSNGVCRDTHKVIIVVEKPSEMEIPNIFSPNGDGLNDVFSVKNTSMQIISAEIFNRWGEKIYSWTDMPNGFWDGRTDGGELAPDGVYFYIISGKGADGVEYPPVQGYVTLVR